MALPTIEYNEERDWTDEVFRVFLECQDINSDPGRLSELHNQISYGSPVEVRKARTWVIRTLRRAAEDFGLGGRTHEQVYGLPNGYLRSGLGYEPRWSRHLQ